MIESKDPYTAFLREPRIGSVAYLYLPNFCWQSAGEVFDVLHRLKPGLSYPTLKVLLSQWTRRGLVIRVPLNTIRDGYCGSSVRFLHRKAT